MSFRRVTIRRGRVVRGGGSRAGVGRGATGLGAVGRATPRLSAVRAAALLAMLVAAAAIYGVASSSAFDLRVVEIPDLQYTSEANIRSNLPVAAGVNLFGLSTESLVAGLEDLPAVIDARVEVALPDRLVVHVRERTPILVWRVADRSYLVDDGGVLFATVDPGSAGATASAALPAVTDTRLSSEAALGAGDSLDPVVLDAATRLASLKPADVGSVATALHVALTDENGFVVQADDDGWQAIFGFYTANLRTTDLIPGQVRLLRSLLADREATIARVVLADDTNGTYQPKPTPKPTATPRLTPTPRPVTTPRPTPTPKS